MGLAHWISLWLLQAAFADTVAVESEPRAGELDQVLLDSCNGALGAPRCSAADAAAGVAPTWLVRVRWDADGRRAQVEFRRGDGSAGTSETREVEFAPADSDAQRRRAVGLIIAAYVVEQAKARAEAAATAQPVPERKPEPITPPGSRSGSDSDSGSDSGSDSDSETVIVIAPDRVLPQRPPEWAIEISVLAGPGFERGAPRVGLQLRGLLWPLALPVAGTASVRGAQRFDQPSVRWLTATLGVIWQLVSQHDPVGLELRGEAVLQNVRVDAEEPGGDDEDSGDAWRAGGIAGVDAWLRLGAGTALVAGLELAVLRPSVYLDIGGEGAGIDPVLTWAGTLGVRLSH